MNPEDRLRELKDPDRWLDVRLPQSRPVAAPTPRRTAPARARTVLAFVIAAAAITALWVGLAGLRPAPQPAGSGAPTAAARQTGTPSPPPTASSSASPTVATAACRPGSLAVRFLYKAGGAAGNWAQTFSIRNTGGTCSIPTTAVLVGDRAARSGNTSPTIALAGRSKTTLYLMAPMTCDAATVNVDRSVTTTVRLELDHVSKVIGSFPTLRCADPFLDR